MGKNDRAESIEGGQKSKRAEGESVVQIDGNDVSADEVLMTDGPFVDSKEQIDRTALYKDEKTVER